MYKSFMVNSDNFHASLFYILTLKMKSSSAFGQCMVND
jgi:hypothetical protein